MQMDAKKQVNHKDSTWKFFDQIAPNYDRLNRVLSAGIDQYWRKQLIKKIPQKSNLYVIDLATGTGDVILELLKKRSDDVSYVLGMDKSKGMLAIAEQKFAQFQGASIKFEHADAQKIPVNDHTADVVTMAFGIRNVPDVSASLKEMHRILKEDGSVYILEFSLPKISLLRYVYLMYFRYVLPLVGKFVSKHPYAYQYLNESVETFEYGSQFAQKMKDAGFKKVTFDSLSFGIATIYKASKNA